MHRRGDQVCQDEKSARLHFEIKQTFFNKPQKENTCPSKEGQHTGVTT